MAVLWVECDVCGQRCRPIAPPQWCRKCKAKAHMKEKNGKLHYGTPHGMATDDEINRLAALVERREPLKGRTLRYERRLPVGGHTTHT